jgi:DNA polymerase III delta subunit
MVFAFFGPDRYRRARARDAFIEELFRRHPQAALGFFDCSSRPIFDIRSFCRTSGLFSPMRIAILRDALSSDDAPGMKSLIREFSSLLDVVLVLDTDSKSIPKPLISHVSPKDGFFAFELLAGPAWYRFADEEARRRDLVLPSGIIRRIADQFSGDSWALATELDTLSSCGENAHCIAESRLSAPVDIWKLYRSAAGRSLGERICSLERLLLAGEPPAKIFHILASFSQKNILRFSEEDIAIKSGSFDYDDALVDLAIR